MTIMPYTSKWKYQDKLAIHQWDRVENSDHNQGYPDYITLSVIIQSRH